MIKYKLNNARDSRVTTASVGGKRIVLTSGEEKIISFTDFKKFEMSLKSLVKSNIITCVKLTGEKAKEAKISSDEPLSDEAKKKLADEAEAKKLEEDAKKDTIVNDESGTEGSDDESKASDDDVDSNDTNSGANVPDDEDKTSTESNTPAQQNQGGRNNKRNRNRNK